MEDAIMKQLTDIKDRQIEKRNIRTPDSGKDRFVIEGVTMEDIRRLKWYEAENFLLRWIVHNRRAWDIICGFETGAQEEMDQIIDQLEKEGFVELEYLMMCKREALEEELLQ